MPEAYYSPMTGLSRSWHLVVLTILAGMISIFYPDIDIPPHASRISRKLAAVHHLRDVLESDEKYERTVSVLADGQFPYTSRAFLQYGQYMGIL